jgi:hypothetical protein
MLEDHSHLLGVPPDFFSPASCCSGLRVFLLCKNLLLFALLLVCGIVIMLASHSHGVRGEWVCQGTGERGGQGRAEHVETLRELKLPK